MSVQSDIPTQGVMRIRIDRPDARNAINAEVREALHAALLVARDDPAVRALVIGGMGGVFSAGGDLPSLIGLDEAAAFARLRDGHRVVSLLWGFPKPVVAAVERFAVGAGAGLALLSDEIVIGEGALLSLPFVKLGLVLDWGLSGTLPRRVGADAATRLYADAAALKGGAARDLGLADRLVADDAVMDTAVQRAEKLALVPPEAFAKTKGRQRGDAETALQLEREAREQAACIVSTEFAEGYAAMREKRDPRF